jgi:replicative DNA helicase
MIDKDFLYYVVSSETYIGQIVSSGFKEIYLDTLTIGSSSIRSLFTVAIDYYLRYRHVINSESLLKYLEQKTFSIDEKKDILLLFEEIKLITPSQDVDFLMDYLKTRYAHGILEKKLHTGSELLVKNDVANAINTIKEAIYSTENIFNETSVSGEVRESIMSRLNYYKDVRDGRVQVGLPTGFPTMDRLTGGMKPGELVVIMAGTREGKSVCLLNVDYHLHMEKNKNVLHVSLENTRNQVERRYDSRCSGLSYTKLRDGTLSADEQEIYAKSLREQRDNKSVFYIWDQPLCSPRGVAAKITELSSKYKFDIIVIDYLGLLSSDRPRKERGWQELSDITLDLRTIARSFKIPIITATQVGRLGMKSKKAHYEHTDIGYSHAIAQNADTVLSFRLSNPDILETGLGICDLNAKLVKCRDGTEGTFILDANFDRMKLQERLII